MKQLLLSDGKRQCGSTGGRMWVLGEEIVHVNVGELVNCIVENELGLGHFSRK